MKSVRDRGEARWLPSRFRYAIFRLLAYAMLRRSKPQEIRGLVLVVDRDQSAVEHYTLAIYLQLTVSCYVAVVLSLYVQSAIAVLAALPVAAFLIEAPLYLTGLAAPQSNAIKLQTVFLFAALTVAASYFATSETWARFAAYLFLTILAINGVCAILQRALRARIVEAERAYGVES